MNLWVDLKYAWRLSKQSWGYSLMCAIVIALGVGIAMFTYEVAYGLTKPLGFPGSESWYSLQITNSTLDAAVPAVDTFTYEELLKHNRSADYIGVYASQGVVLSEGQVSTRLRASAISPRLLAATQVPPRLGRVLEDADTQIGAAPVAVLSFDTWQNYFAGDPDIIGKTARMDAAPVQIVGVMPKDFYEFNDFEVWLPLHLETASRPTDATMSVSPIILLGPGQNINTILNEMKAAHDGIVRDYPDIFKTTRHVVLIPAKRMFTHSQTPILLTLTFMCSSVLLLGCLDISMVFLARLLERSRELALRTALGASRWRILRQCVLETALVLPPGLLGGYGLAALMFRWSRSLYSFTAQILATGRPAQMPFVRPGHVITGVLAAIIIWLLSTLVPAWRIAKQDAAVTLAGSGTGAPIRVGNKSAGLMVGLQVVISCLVMVLCACMVLGVKKELGKDSGMNTAQVMLSTSPAVFSAHYSEPAQRMTYLEDLTAAVESKMPGAEVAFATDIPSRPSRDFVAIETQHSTQNLSSFALPLTTISDNYFNVLGLTLRSGRLFDGTDSTSSLKVAIVDERMAARYWPNQDVLGKRIQFHPLDNGPWFTIVGVVSPVTGRPYSSDTGVIYQSWRQLAPSAFHVLVKLPNAASDSRTTLQAAAYGVDRDLPLQNLQTLNDYLAAVDLGFSSLVPTFIAVALVTALLAATGLFGLITRSVAQRTQEVGIRRALGATAWQATSMFMRQGALYLGVALVGISIGVMMANIFSGTITNILDYVVPVTLGAVLLMAIVIFTASHLPSRRAVALEPGDALRYQ